MTHNCPIITKLKKLISAFPKTTLIAVVFVAGATLLNLLVLERFYQPFGPDGSSGGLAIFAQSLPEDGNFNLEIGSPAVGFTIAASDEETAGFIFIESAAVLNANSPLSNILPTRDGLLIYKVREGDNLSSIAAKFGISVNTILGANDKLRANLIKPGQEILILPVSGALHNVQEGETLESIAALYGVDVAQILKYNKPSSDVFIIPGAKPVKTSAVVSATGLPDLRGYFVIPTTGWNWGRLHPVNGVDIANACGTPVYAAAEGLVVAARSYGWNSGYGNYVDIEHPNNVITRYSHTQKNAVSVGDYVLQGDLIAYIGNTGNTHGPTGCHLHFEVKGARNPFAK